MLYLIDSPYVIRPKSLFINETTETIYLVMEYCQYPSLQRYMTLNIVSYAETRKVPTKPTQIIRKLLEAVCDMHRVGVCHRDIKPDNILYDAVTGDIKIIDLGVSKLIYNKKENAKVKMWTVTGTIQYKAPEMFQGKEYDELVDSWAVGIITYQLIYGKLPFEADLLVDLIELIVCSDPQFPYSTDPDETLAVDFIRSLLSKDHRRSTCFEASHHPWMSGSRSRLASEDIANQ